ncbi:MAG: hypothetical protein AAF433_01915 [Bacteroidota bacterium]
MGLHPRLLLMIVMIAYFLYRIGKGIWESYYLHAEDEDLKAFWNGTLEAEDKKAHQRLRDHLGSCDSCNERLQEIIESGETRYSENRKVMSRRF